MKGWHTSIGSAGKAHFYADGRPACGDLIGIWPGVRRAALFTRPTRETVDDDHVCRDCAKVEPRICMCGRCAVSRVRARTAKSVERTPRKLGRRPGRQAGPREFSDTPAGRGLAATRANIEALLRGEESK